ncbi:putative type VI secretion protein [Escherichia coli]|uniref:Putative type VI secretion protein n=1 Tax=Escherichia coli TaxID=562 RepID=A0A3S4L8V0_ECOLX|nr:putative type VI secretion protein [Escherichia coli]
MCVSVSRSQRTTSQSAFPSLHGEPDQGAANTSEPSLRIVNGQLCIPPSFCLFPDKGQFIVRSVLHSERDKDTPRIMVAGIEIADGCIFDIPLNDMEVVRPYGELKSSNVQTDQSERHGPLQIPFQSCSWSDKS